MGIFIFYRRGPSLQERRDDAGQRIWIIPKNNNKKQKNGNTTKNEATNSSAQLMAVHSFRGSFLFLFFPLPSSCEWWWWRYSSEAVCALFIHTLIPSQTAGHLRPDVERESQWSNRIELTPKGRKSRTALFFHFHFLSPFFFLHYSASSRLIYLQQLTGLQTRNERV